MIIATQDWIPAKPHEYKGINYRSKLEAEWAKYMDDDHIKFEYEKKTFEMDRLWYCPDFYLPQIDMWLEIKGFMDKLSLRKVTEFSSYKRFPDRLFIGFKRIGDVVNATERIHADVPWYVKEREYSLSAYVRMEMIGNILSL